MAGGGAFNFFETTLTRTFADGSVFFWVDILGGAADYGEFLATPAGVQTFMTTADALPAGAYTSFRTFRVGAAGPYVGFVAGRAGGTHTIFVVDERTGAVARVAGYGDIAPGTGGGRLRSWPSTVFLNASGKAVFAAAVIGGAATGLGTAGIFQWDPMAGLAKVVAPGDIEPSTGLPFVGAAVAGQAPSPLNDAGQVAFRAALKGPTTSVGGIFLGMAGATPQKIALQGELAPGSGTFQLSSGYPAINRFGQVAFSDAVNIAPNVTAGAIFIGTPGGGVAQVVRVGDAAPGGDTFTVLPTAFSLNDNGEVAFVAAVGSGGGVFVGSGAAPPAAIALSGQAAPSGGNFNFSTPFTPDAAISNQGDIIFRARLAGGSADSGYFMRRGYLGALQTVALQGDTAPGTAWTFRTMSASLNNVAGENFALSSTGELAFGTMVGPGPLFGFFRYRTDNRLEKIVLRGDPAPGSNGGTTRLFTQATGTDGLGHFAIYVGNIAGSFNEAIYLVVNTPGGENVTIAPVDSTTKTAPVTLTFDNIATAGDTNRTTSSTGSAPPPGFAVVMPPLYFDVSTTAVFSGGTNVCVDYSGVAYADPASLRLFHFENGRWVDVTTSNSSPIICGRVSSLSPFAVFQEQNPADQIRTLLDMVAGFGLPKGTAVSLTASLHAALTALQAPKAAQRKDAAATLSAFISQVEAQRGKTISNEQADQLIALAARIISRL